MARHDRNKQIIKKDTKFLTPTKLNTLGLIFISILLILHILGKV